MMDEDKAMIELQVKEELQIKEELQVPDELQVKEELQVTDELQVKEELQVTDELQVKEELQVTDELQVKEELQITDELQVKEELQVTDELQVKEELHVTEDLHIKEEEEEWTVTQRSYSPPRQLWSSKPFGLTSRKQEITEEMVVLKDSSPMKLIHQSCTCVAGAPLCNHCMLSCTEGEQQWHKHRTLGIRPGPVDRMAVLSAKPKCGATTEGVRSILYKGLSGDLPDRSVLQVTEVYKDFSAAEAPMICSMGISCEIPLADSALGLVQAGSPLSYQQPATAKRDLSFHAAPPPPSVPLQNYSLQPSSCMFVCSEPQQLHLKSLEVTWDMVHKFECATRAQSLCGEWHQLKRPRLTASWFREICQVRESSEDSLAARILQGTHQTAAMKRGLEMEADAIWEYCQMKRVNHYPCGFVIHPDAPWLGASPDGLIFDPSEPCQFGLIEIKCPDVKSYIDCPYLKMSSGKLELKQTHAYYSQVQGQMLITGMSWCDFVVSTEEDILIQRIYKDSDMLDVIKEKVDRFYFHVYMQKCM